MTVGNKPLILAEGRWNGAHGIGRFSSETLSRLHSIAVQSNGPKPLSLLNLVWQPYQLIKNKKHFKLFFNPGFNPLLYSPIPFVFIIHDLNHLHFPASYKFLKKLYYHTLVKYSALRAAKILTVSEYSKKTIIEWLHCPEDKVVVVEGGVSTIFQPEGERHVPGYRYVLHVGNTKVHKNVVRLLLAFANAAIDPAIKFILTGEETQAIRDVIREKHLENRIIFAGKLSEQQLGNYYRGALALLFPSLYEGFGLPVIESMACGTPVMTSDVTSLPEVASDAALLVNPYDIAAMSTAITQLVTDQSLRETLIAKGLQRAKRFTWDNTANKIQAVLNSLTNQ